MEYGFIANGGQGGTPDIWSLVSGTLPAGLRLYTPYYGAQTTIIYGTPTTEQTTTFTLQAQDPLGDTVQQTCTLTVGPPAPLAVNNPNPRCMLGTVGVAYQVNMFASGGVRPYTWSIVTGKVPPGLPLDSSPFPLRPPGRTGRAATGAAQSSVAGCAALAGLPGVLHPSRGIGLSIHACRSRMAQMRMIEVD